MGFYFLRELEEVLKDIIVLFGIFRMPVRDKNIAVISTAMFFLFSVVRCQWWEDYYILYWIVGFVIGYGWILLIGGKTWWKNCLYYSLARLLIDCVDEIICMSIVLFGRDNTMFLEKGNWHNVLINAVSILLFLLMAFVVQKYRVMDKVARRYLLIPCGAIGFSALLMAFCLGKILDYAEKYTAVIIVSCICCCVLLIFLSILLVFFLYSRQYYKQLYQLRMEYQQLQSDHYKELHEKSVKFQELRHDYRHKVNYMAELFRAERWEELGRFLGNVEGEYESTRVIATGYFPGDAVANHFCERMRQKGILLDWMGYFPIGIEIEETDFCSLLSNLLENAMEACEKITSSGGAQTPVVHVEVQRDENYIYLDMANPVPSDERTEFTLQTEKENSEHHGIGTKSVRSIVEKYGGQVTWEFDGEEVCVSVVLPYRVAE